MEGVIAMSVKERKVYQLGLEVLHQKLSIKEFSILIGRSYRQSKRIIKKIREKDAFGVKHGNSGRKPTNRTDLSLEEDILKLLKTKYYDFNLTHFREMIFEQEGLRVGKNIIHRIAKKNGLIKRPKRRSRKAYKPRVRFPAEGMLVQFDGSEHIWFGDTHCDLIVGIDDATSRILGAEFFMGETALHCLKVMHDITASFGTPEAYYFDQAGYFGKQDRAQYHTQIGRALETLGSLAILAGSPQAKGRVERLFNTLQDRLIAELRFHNIKTIFEANEFLKNHFIPKHNQQFMIAPRDKNPRFRKSDPALNLQKIFCIKENRKINSANSFSWNAKTYVVQSDKNYRFRRININTHFNGSVSFDVMGLELSVQEYVPQRKNEYYPLARKLNDCKKAS